MQPAGQRIQAVLTDTDRAQRLLDVVQHHRRAGYWLELAGTEPWLDEDHPPVPSPQLTFLPTPVLYTRITRVIPIISSPTGDVVTHVGNWQSLLGYEVYDLVARQAKHVLFEVEFQTPVDLAFRTLGIYRFGQSQSKGLVSLPNQIYVNGLEVVIYQRVTYLKQGDSYRFQFVREM